MQLTAQVKISQMPTIIGNDTDSLWLPALQDGVNRKVRGWQLKPLSNLDSWNISGNSGTIDGTNFIGTTDNVPFNIRVNNQKAGRIDLTNAFFGYQAANSNTTGFGNVAIGNNAMYSNINGSSNVMIGRDAGYSNTSGFNNVAVGRYALYSNLGGNLNTAVGWGAMFNNTSGIRNIAVGVDALPANTIGTYNTASGSRSLYGNTTGDSNTSYGADALLSTSTGSSNTAIGANSFKSNETGSENTAIGANTDVSSSNLTNATAIGANAYVSQSNSLVLGSINGVNGATSDVEVGVGISAPQAKLHIKGGNTRVTNNGYGFYAESTDGETGGAYLGTDVSGYPKLTLSKQAAEISATIRIDSMSEQKQFQMSNFSGPLEAFIPVSVNNTFANKQGNISLPLVTTLTTNTSDVGNMGAGEDDLMTYTIPAGKLVTNGDYLEFTMTITFAANANNKQVKVYFGSTAIYTSGSHAQNDGSMEIKGTIIRTGATSQRITFSQANNTMLFPDYANYVTASEILANAITLKATGEGTSNNDIVQKMLTVKYFPAN